MIEHFDMQKIRRFVPKSKFGEIITKSWYRIRMDSINLVSGVPWLN
jgi:hypothetical protein